MSEPISISSLMQRNNPSQQCNWVNVLEFLHDQHKQMQYKECEWALEKSQMQSKINELEGVIKGLERVVGDLGKRAKMLEVALRQERLKQNGQSTDLVGQLLKENMNNSQIQNYQTIPKRKAKPYRPLLQKILQEVGISSIFSPPGSPKMDPSNRPSVLLTPNQTQPLIAQNSGRQSPTNMNATSGFPTHSRNKSQIDSEVQQVAILRNHFDSVRDVHFFDNVPLLASISEDCQLKLWDIQNLAPQNQLEPYLTLREHTGPILAIAVVEAGPKRTESLIFTAGTEGVISVSGVPQPDEFDQFGPTEEYQQFLNSWEAHADAVWQLCVNQQQSALLSSGADGMIKLWSMQDIVTEPRLLQQYAQKDQDDLPTALCWVGPNHFAAGFALQPSLIVYDSDSGRVATSIKYNSQGQINQISLGQNNQLIASHEDGKVRIYDVQQQKIVNTIAVNNEPVNSAILNNNGTQIYIATSSLKVWDIRKQQFIQELNPHQPKYDECINKLVHHPNQNIFASCGADGIIKLFSHK